MTGTVIKIKYSTVTAQPADDTLEIAELAYSYISGSNTLFIGADDGAGGTTAVKIGGQKYVNYLDHAKGTLTASAAILVDSNKWVDEIITGGLTLTTSGGSGTQKVTSISTEIDGTSTNGQLITALAVKNYVDTTAAAVDLGELNDVTITNATGAQILLYDSINSEWVNRGLSGDVTINESGVADIAATGVTTGSFGSATSIPTFTVAADGRLTAAGSVNVATSLNVRGDDLTTTTVDLLTDTLSIGGGTGISTTTSADKITVKLNDTSVIAGAYGSTSAIPTFTVDQQGRLTSAGSVSITTSLSIQGDTGTDTVSLANDTLDFAGGVALTSSVTDNVVTYNLVNTSVTAGAYGSATTIPTFTVDAQGRLTAAGSALVSTTTSYAGDSGLGNITTGSALTIAGGVGLTTEYDTGTLTVDLDNTAVTAGSYGNATTIPTFTVDAQGRLTAAGTVLVSTTTSIAGDTGSGSVATGSAITFAGGTGLTTDWDTNNDTLTVTLDDTAVTAGTYGAATTIPQFTVDAQGRITNATTVSINANSYGTFSVDQAGTFTWADSGTTVASGNADTVRFVSGEGINLWVDGTNDAVKFDNTGVLSNVAGTHITVSSSTGNVTIGTDATSANTVSTIVARDASGDFASNKATLNELQVDDININGNVISTTTTDENLQLTANGDGIVEITSDTNITGGLTITGDLTVTGTSTQINVQELVVEDPIIYLASAQTPGVDTTTDIGFVGNYISGGVYAHTGLVRHTADGIWYLFDQYTPEVDENGNVVDIADASFNIASLNANVVGTLTGVAETATKLLNLRTISLSGDVVGSLEFDGSADANMAVTIQPNSVALGTDTTGNYVATLASSNGGLTVTDSGSESSAVSIELDTTNSTFTNGAKDAFGASINGGTYTNIALSYNTGTKVVTGSVNTATTAVKGIASFSADNFTVTSGVVTVSRIEGGTF